jgi:hypothetical protein
MYSHLIYLNLNKKKVRKEAARGPKTHPHLRRRIETPKKMTKGTVEGLLWPPAWWQWHQRQRSSSSSLDSSTNISSSSSIVPQQCPWQPRLHCKPQRGSEKPRKHSWQ